MPFKIALAALLALAGQGPAPDRIVAVGGCGPGVPGHVRIPADPERQADPAACHMAATSAKRRHLPRRRA